MPVDENFSLDNPEGLTDDDIRKLNEDADELEQIAIKAEENAEKIKKAKQSLEGLNFAQLDILKSTVSETTTSTGVAGSIGSYTQEQLMELVINIMKTLEENKTKMTAEEKARKELEAEMRRLDAEMKSGIRKFGSSIEEIDRIGTNPMSFAQGKIMGFIGKAGIIGVIAGMVVGIGEMIYDKIMKSFEAGGANDIRKAMLDRDREITELDDILARRSGRVFFTADVDLRQGAPQFSNTERLRDQTIRYQSLHIGE